MLHQFLVLFLALVPVREAAEGLSEAYSDMAESVAMKIPGQAEVETVAKEWLAGASTFDDKKKLAESIVEKIFKAAEPEHDIFKGVKIFATTMQKALDSGDEKALDKQLALREKFVKGVDKVVKRIQAESEKMAAQIKAAEEAQKQAQNAKAAESTDDDDDDPDFGDDADEAEPGGASDDDDEF